MCLASEVSSGAGTDLNLTRQPLCSHRNLLETGPGAETLMPLYLFSWWVVQKRMATCLPVFPPTCATSSPMDRQLPGTCLPTGYLLQIILPMSGATSSCQSVESPQRQPNLSHSDFAHLPTPKHKTPSETHTGTFFLKWGFLKRAALSQRILHVTKKSHSSFKPSSHHTDRIMPTAAWCEPLHLAWLMKH